MGREEFLRLKLKRGEAMDMEEVLAAAKLRTSTLPQDLSPEEQSIIEDIIDSPTVQTRLKNYLLGIVLARVEGVLSWVPFKKRILGFIWNKLNEEIDDLIEKVKEWRDNRDE